MEIPKILKASLGEFDRIELYGLSDWHLGSEYCERKHLQKFIDHIQHTPNAFCVVLGDLMDNALKGSLGNVYMSTMNPNAQIKEAANILYPIKDKILGICEGNHEVRSIKEVGLLPMYILTTKLFQDDAKIDSIYSVGAFVLFLSYKDTSHPGKTTAFSLYCKHGSGGGGTVAGKANAMAKMKADFIADIYISGHTHHIIGFPEKTFIADSSRKVITENNHLFVNSGSFLKWGGYAVEKSYAPTVTGSPKIELWTERCTRGMDRLIKRAETTIGF